MTKKKKKQIGQPVRAKRRGLRTESAKSVSHAHTSPEAAAEWARLRVEKRIALGRTHVRASCKRSPQWQLAWPLPPGSVARAACGCGGVASSRRCRRRAEGTATKAPWPASSWRRRHQKHGAKSTGAGNSGSAGGGGSSVGGPAALRRSTAQHHVRQGNESTTRSSNPSNGDSDAACRETALARGGCDAQQSGAVHVEAALAEENKRKCKRRSHQCRRLTTSILTPQWIKVETDARADGSEAEASRSNGGTGGQTQADAGTLRHLGQQQPTLALNQARGARFEHKG